MDLHRLGGIRSQDTVEGSRILDVVVQPEGLQLPWQDDRHPVVDGTERLVGRRGNDGAGADDLALRSRHASHRPAKAKGSPDAITIRMGLLLEPFPCHS